VESGIPPFSGPGCLWGERYHPRTLGLFYIRRYPREYSKAEGAILRPPERGPVQRRAPVLAAWEACGLLKALITQSMDNPIVLSGLPQYP